MRRISTETFESSGRDLPTSQTEFTNSKRGSEFSKIGVVAILAIILASILFVGNVFALTEVPGNGFDDDGSGGDQACAAPDADCDGYTTDGTSKGYDCDDTNRKIYPGVNVWTSGTSWKTCQTNGTYTSPSNTCPDHACYYIDPTSGSDANVGTSAATAFQHLTMVSYYSSGAPSGNAHSGINCGDHIYLLPGTYNSGQFHVAGGIYDEAGLILHNKSCAATPITIDFIGAAIIDGNTVYSSSVDGSAIFIENSPGTIIRMNELGEIKRIFSGWSHENGAIRIEATDGIEIAGGYIHDNTGSGTSNGSGIYVGGVSRNVNVHHVEVVDQLWAGGVTQSNVCLFMEFDGSGRISYSSFRNTAGATASCGVRLKHGTCNLSGGVCTDSYRFDHNKLSKAPSLLSFIPNTTVDHNIFADCSGADNQISLDRANAFEHGDNGGAGFDGANVLQYNTMLNCGFYSWNPNNDYNQTTLAGCSNCGTFGTLAIDHNVVKDNAASTNASTAIAMIDPYGSDADFSSNITHATKPAEDYNCVFATGAAALEWSWYGKTTNPAGDDLTHAQLVSAGYNTHGANIDPSLNSSLVATAGSCTGFGWNVGWSESGGGGGGGGGSCDGGSYKAPSVSSKRTAR